MIYAVTYKTESGDEGFAGLFLDKPDDDHLKALAREEYPEEYDDFTIYFEVYPVEALRALPKVA